MVNGLYTARNGMMLLQEMQDNTAHNLSNANTSGFKKSLMVSMSQVEHQQEYSLMHDLDPKALEHQDEDHWTSENYIDYSQGPLVGTENDFDLAIEGDGFFTVETENGTRYTRNGSFTRNGMGELVTLQGNRVLGKGGSPIDLTDYTEFQVSPSGAVYGNGEKVADLDIVDFEDKRTALGREGGNLFYNRTGAETIQPGRFSIKQGFVESSNVSIIDSMVDMIRFQRNYEMNQKSIQSEDETLDKAVNSVGVVS
jgi:flagellar basal-body rod protein FlgG